MGSVVLSVYYDHHSPDYQCTKLPECEYRGQEILTRHRLGDDQEHQCWDKREDIRGVVMKKVSREVGQDMASKRVFINRLLVNTEVFNIVQTIQEKNKSEQTVSGDEHEIQNKRELYSLIQGESIIYEKEKTEKQKGRE